MSDQARAKPLLYHFNGDGETPNNPLPLLVYRNAVRIDDVGDPAAAFEAIFHANGWGRSWRNGVFPYLHYHSAIHEVLGIARGSARIRFGGNAGVELTVAAGDVAVLPAGVGHQRLSDSAGLLVVGAYPPDGEYDLCRGSAAEYARAQRSIPQVAQPQADPLYGHDGPLVQLWRGA